MSEIFPADHLALIEERLNSAKFTALKAVLPRLSEIFEKAQAMHCCCFSCQVELKKQSLRVIFKNYEGDEYATSLSFQRAYEAAGGVWDVDVLCDLCAVVESLVLNLPGIEPLAHIRRRAG